MRHILAVLLGSGFVLGAALLSSATGNGPSDPVTSAPVTYTKDIAPVLQKNCAKCHRPGEVAPMSLLTYKQVRPWARSIREMVVERRMPPWFADSHYGQFSNDCRLSQKEIDAIAAWVDGGAVEGDPKDLPAALAFLDGWNIGKPDVVLSMTRPYSVPADGVIDYKFFVVPTNFKEDRYVQFAEIRPGNRAIVHHVIVDVMYPGKNPLPPAGELDFATLGGGRRSAGEGGGTRAAGEGGGRSAGEGGDGRLVGWAPGEAPLMLNGGQAKLIKAGSVLIFQVHYTTNGVAGDDVSSVGLIFSRGMVEKRVITAGAVAHSLEIPPGAPNYEAVASFDFKEDSHIESLHPHMHFRGKDFAYRLIYPDGTSRILLSVPRWDFGWQLTYFLKEPVAAPKGSRLECVAHYDNSTNNKYNPDPTRLVRWGPQTWDEMMIGYLDYTIDSQNLHINNETAAR